MKIKLTNSFHGTEAYVITKYGNLSERQVKELRKKLCPYRDCQCSGSLGTRGSEVDGFVFKDGTAKLDLTQYYHKRV